MNLEICAICGRWIDTDDEDVKIDEEGDTLCEECFEEEIYNS